MRSLLLSFSFVLPALVLALTPALATAQEVIPPPAQPAVPVIPPKTNVVLIVADDLGYSDLRCYGSTVNRTPNLDTLASQGTRFTSFCVAQAVCSASRAALMTGCYPNRVGMQGALNHTSLEGIHPDEFLLPEMFKQHGYATAIHGKWHLGTAAMFNPLHHGFDEFTGIPYSNDNSKYHPSLAAEMPPLPWYDDGKVTQTDPDQTQFTRRLTEKAVTFIRRHGKQPFFLYVPHIMPHVPIFASERFKGKSPNGLYGDVIEELDWSVGLILAALDQAGVSDHTLVLFMSDNGPFLSYGNHAGVSAPLREGKLTSYEGGVRVPFIARWPGKIPAGKVSDELLTEMDLMPTLTRLADEESAARSEIADKPTARPAPAPFTTSAPPPPALKPGSEEMTHLAARQQADAEVEAGKPRVTPKRVLDQLTNPSPFPYHHIPEEGDADAPVKQVATAEAEAKPAPVSPTATPTAPAAARKIDGLDVTDLLLGKEGAKNPREVFAVYAGNELQALRSGEWKLHFPHPYITPHEVRGVDGKPSNWENMKPAAITQSGIEGIATRHGYQVAQQPLALYNLREDPGETTDVSAQHADVVERLKQLAEPIRQQLGDTLTQTPATEARPLGKAEKL